VNNHKKARNRLFKHDRPHIRPLQITENATGSGFSKDISIVWVAHKHHPIPLLSDINTQEDFLLKMLEAANRLPFYVVEDRNREFDGMGLIALIAVKGDDWRIEPHVHFFPWATKRNILRTCIAFFQMIRYSKKTGVCVVKSLKESTVLFDKCVNYFPPNVFHAVGKIPMGDIRGDEYIYSIRGKKWAT